MRMLVPNTWSDARHDEDDEERVELHELEGASLKARHTDAEHRPDSSARS